MKVSYKKLWKLLIDNNMNKSKLCEIADITTNEMAKMGKDEMVRMKTLMKICEVFNCKLDDIVEYSVDKGDKNEL
jgi:putative transcriptional regulator